MKMATLPLKKLSKRESKEILKLNHQLLERPAWKKMPNDLQNGGKKEQKRNRMPKKLLMLQE